MPRYDLAGLWAANRRPGRREVVLRAVTISPVLAGDLFRAAFLPLLEAWTSALPAIEAEYERTLSTLTMDSPEDVSAILSSVERDVTGRMVSIKLALRRWADLLERHHRQKWRGAVLVATGVDLQTMIGPAEARVTLETAVERNVALVSSVSDETRRRIAEEVFGGFTARRPAREIAKALREKVAMSRRRALNISADQVSKLGAQLNVERAREAGLTRYEWVSSHKLHFRPEHAARDGKRYDYGTPAGDEPGMAIWCGCTARAVLGDEA